MSRHVGLARVPVILEAAAVRGGEPAWVSLLQVGEDRPGAAEEPPVLGLQHGDPVGAGDLAQVRSLLRPRFHLADDGIDAELG